MKRSEMITILEDIIYDEICLEDWTPTGDEGNLSRILDRLEKVGMTPPSYINPKVIENKLENVTQYLDKYPAHHYRFGIRPYEYYLEGWEDEEE